MLLDKKNAVVYGGAGHMGGAVARAFAREGALVYLASPASGTMSGSVLDLSCVAIME